MMSTLLRTFRKNRSLKRHVRGRRFVPALDGLDQRCLLDAGIGYVQTNLVSDIKGLAATTDPNLQNPWGISQNTEGQFRAADNATGVSTEYSASGQIIGTPVTIPTPPGVAPPSAPNGNVFNTTSDFVISHDGKSAPATVIFSSENGTIVGFNPAVDPNEGILEADLSQSGAVFKTLTAGSVNGANYIYASDFHNGTVDVFNGQFQLVHLSGSFTDPNIPAGFAPFGLKNVNGTLFVTYAKQDGARHDDVAGVGNGFIDEFTLSGNFIERFASQGLLNSPHGIAVAPDNFGQFSNALLVGNFGDSKVNAFNLNTGQFLGQLTDAHGNTLILNGGFKNESDTKGLWGLTFGDGQNGAATNSLFFAAGINDENDGLFGKVTVSGEDFGQNGIVKKIPHFYEDYKGPKLAQLNSVAAAGELKPDGSFEFIGVNQGALDPKVAATYVFGIDRNGKLPTGPFNKRPDIRFDALIEVSVKPGQATTASVIDLAKHTTTSLPQGSFSAEGRVIAVTVPGSLLPSTGLPPSQFRFNYWPENPDPALKEQIASFTPEFNDAQVGVIA
jgi:uncharacterized protein (TIGR03118 family)